MVLDRLRLVCSHSAAYDAILTVFYTAGDPSDPVHIKSIEISPDPPKPGANMTVKVVGQADEEVEVSVTDPHSKIPLTCA